jgi:hypothetical protein
MAEARQDFRYGSAVTLSVRQAHYQRNFAVNEYRAPTLFVVRYGSLGSAHAK